MEKPWRTFLLWNWSALFFSTLHLTHEERWRIIDVEVEKSWFSLPILVALSGIQSSLPRQLKAFPLLRFLSPNVSFALFVENESSMDKWSLEGKLRLDQFNWGCYILESLVKIILDGETKDIGSPKGPSKSVAYRSAWITSLIVGLNIFRGSTHCIAISTTF
jgi:hypothetical protein